jgi:hypothetical protein
MSATGEATRSPVASIVVLVKNRRSGNAVVVDPWPIITIDLHVNDAAYVRTWRTPRCQIRRSDHRSYRRCHSRNAPYAGFRKMKLLQ